jgi:hypothetical protein
VRDLPGCRIEHRAVLSCADPARGLSELGCAVAASGLGIVALSCDAAGRIAVTLDDPDGGAAARLARPLVNGGLRVETWVSDAVFRP